MSITYKLDLWTLFGLTAQGLFFLRFVIQWYYSEKAKKTVIPKIFWYLSLTASVMVLIYSVVRADLVFLIASLLQILMYSRNLALFRAEDRRT